MVLIHYLKSYFLETEDIPKTLFFEIYFRIKKVYLVFLEIEHFNYFKLLLSTSREIQFIIFYLSTIII